MPRPKAHSDEALLSLRSITSLLSSTSETDLPPIVPSLISQLHNRPVLTTALTLSSSPGRQQEPASLLLTKFKTRVSALLGSKQSSARWSGVVLAKVSFETSADALASWGGQWVRLVVPLLSRPEPVALHTATIRMLTAVYSRLTKDKPALTREIVTPHLPTTLTALYNLASSSSTDREVLVSSLESVRDLLLAHPVTFRPFAVRFEELCVGILSSGTQPRVESSLREIWAGRYLCASGGNKRDASGQNKKGAVAAEWGGLLKSVVADLHEALDTILKPIIEDFVSAIPTETSTMAKNEMTALGLKAVADMVPATERVLLLLRMLRSFFEMPAPEQISIPLGTLLNVVGRIFAASVSSQASPKVEKTERELLFSRLPGIQSEALDLVTLIASRLQPLFVPHAQDVLEQVTQVFEDHKYSADVRISVFDIFSTVFNICGAGLSKDTIAILRPVLTAATDDLLPHRTPPPPPAQKDNKGPQKTRTTHADSFLPSAVPVSRSSTTLIFAASNLVKAVLEKLPSSTEYIHSELRTRLDRAAVLTGNREALMASVMFPPPNAKASVLPHLVGAGVPSLAVESLIRPRMPVIWTAPRSREAQTKDDAFDDEEAYAEEVSDSDSLQDAEEPSRKRARASPPPTPTPTLRRKASALFEPGIPQPVLPPSSSPLVSGISPAKRSPRSGPPSSPLIMAADSSPPPQRSPGVGRWSSPPIMFALDDREPVKEMPSVRDKREERVVSEGLEEDEDEDDLSIPEIVMGEDSDSDDG